MRPGHTNTLSPCYNYYTPPLKRARRGTAANVRTLQKGDRLRVWLYLGSSGPTPLSRTESDTVTDGGGGGGNDASNKGSSLRQYVVPRSLVQVLDAHNPAVTLSEDGTSITSRWSDAIFLRAFPRVKDGPQAIRAGPSPTSLDDTSLMADADFDSYALLLSMVVTHQESAAFLSSMAMLSIIEEFASMWRERWAIAQDMIASKRWNPTDNATWDFWWNQGPQMEKDSVFRIRSSDRKLNIIDYAADLLVHLQQVIGMKNECLDTMVHSGSPFLGRLWFKDPMCQALAKRVAKRVVTSKCSRRIAQQLVVPDKCC